MEQGERQVRREGEARTHMFPGEGDRVEEEAGRMVCLLYMDHGER